MRSGSQTMTRRLNTAVLTTLFSIIILFGYLKIKNVIVSFVGLIIIESGTAAQKRGCIHYFLNSGGRYSSAIALLR